MKKFISASIVILTALPAIAATRCVPSTFVECDVSVDTMDAFGLHSSNSNWYSVCIKGNETSLDQATVIKGVFLCAADSGNHGDAAIAPDAGDYSHDNQCWCKMIQPAISKWIYYGRVTGDTPCDSFCASRCSDGFTWDNAFRNAFFSNLENL